MNNTNELTIDERIEMFNRTNEIDYLETDSGIDLTDTFIHSTYGYGEGTLQEAIDDAGWDVASIIEACEKPFDGESYCIWWGDGRIQFCDENEITTFLDSVTDLDDMYKAIYAKFR